MNSARLGHGVLRQVLRPGDRAFTRQRDNLENAQRDRLAQILRQVSMTRPERAPWHGHWDWASFGKAEPVTSYDDWRPAIAEQMDHGRPQLTGSPVARYQPTSGSSSAIKWIPYTRQFLKELDGAIAPWMADLYRQYPGIARGKQYWSLSWLPSDMRQQGQDQLNDDMKLLSAGKRVLMTHTQAVPEAVALAPSSEDAMFATLAYLASTSSLATLSVWSPTFAIGLLNNLSRWRQPIQEVLRTGSWGSRGTALFHLKAPRSTRAADKLAAWDDRLDPEFFRELWPSLALVSAWDTASAAPWASELRKWLPHAGFQGKGLWATEGVVTIPQGDQHVLAANSHVYEFEDPVSGRIFPPWELEVGQEVGPLITSGSGMLRYRLGDRLRVTGHRGELPCLQFLGRSNTVDLVGEKMDAVRVQQWLDSVPWPGGARPVTVLGTASGGPRGRPGYVLVVNLPAGFEEHSVHQHEQAWGPALERFLLESFHYRLARDLGQLDPARCVCQPNAYGIYIEACRKRGMIEGDIKVESLKHWPTALPEEFRTNSLVMEEAHEA